MSTGRSKMRRINIHQVQVGDTIAEPKTGIPSRVTLWVKRGDGTVAINVVQERTLSFLPDEDVGLISLAEDE